MTQRGPVATAPEESIRDADGRWLGFHGFLRVPEGAEGTPRRAVAPPEEWMAPARGSPGVCGLDMLWWQLRGLMR